MTPKENREAGSPVNSLRGGKPTRLIYQASPGEV